MIIAFFALCCFFFLLTVLSLTRWCSMETSNTSGQSKSGDNLSTNGSSNGSPNIVNTLLVFIVITCIARLVGWTACTTYYF